MSHIEIQRKLNPENKEICVCIIDVHDKLLGTNIHIYIYIYIYNK